MSRHHSHFRDIPPSQPVFKPFNKHPLRIPHSTPGPHSTSFPHSNLRSVFNLVSTINHTASLSSLQSNLVRSNGVRLTQLLQHFTNHTLTPLSWTASPSIRSYTAWTAPQDLHEKITLQEDQSTPYYSTTPQ